MKHATAQALAQLEPLLEQIRQRNGHNGFKEKKPGIFYQKSKAFLHFHEDPAGLFADILIDADFKRYRVNTSDEQTIFLEVLDQILG